jgi:hypothetical protein
MKKVSGGNFPTCTVYCYFDSYTYVTEKIINYPIGMGCSGSYENACPEGYRDVVTCTCP